MNRLPIFALQNALPTLTQANATKFPWWRSLLMAGVTLLAPVASALGPAAPDLASSANFAILAGGAITGTGGTGIVGDVGTSPTTGATIGLTQAQVTGTIYAVDNAGPIGSVVDPDLLAQAKADLAAAYDAAAGLLPIPTGEFLEPGNGDLANLNLAPGLYKVAAAATLSTGSLTLTGSATDVWVFQIGSTLVTADNTTIVLAGGARASNVYWQVGSSATIGASSTFKGTILALQSVTMNSGCLIEGRALASNAALTYTGASLAIPLDPVLPEVTIRASRSSYATEPSTSHQFILERTGPTTSALSVQVMIAGSATKDLDYSAMSSTDVKTINIPAGRAKIGVLLVVLDDALIETPETVVMTLQTGLGYTIGSPADATITIVSNDAVVTVLPGNQTIEEAGSARNFRFSRTGPTTAPLRVKVSISGTATPDSDYVALADSVAPVVTIPAGRSSVGVLLTLINDLQAESNETVIMTVLADGAYAVGSPSQATYTIISDEPAPESRPASLPAAGQTLAGIASVTPAMTALGNELLVQGHGLSAKHVTASLVGFSANGWPVRHALEVLQASDSAVVVRVKHGRPADYLLELQLQGGPTYTSGSLISLQAPELLGVSPSSVAAGSEVTLTGQYFGMVKGLVSVGQQRAKVLHWTTDSISIRLPVSVSAGDHAVIVQTKLGASLEAITLSIE